MHCTNCGKEVPSDAEFCSGCGTKVAVSQAELETTTKKQPSRKMAGCLVLLCIMGFLAWLVSDSSESTDPAPTEGITEPKPVGDTTTDGTRQINGTNRFGCSDRELYEKLGFVRGTERHGGLQASSRRRPGVRGLHEVCRR